MAPTGIRIPINNVKGGGDYTGEIRIGSQSVTANVILDTGSSTLAVVPRLYQIAADKNVTSAAPPCNGLIPPGTAPSTPESMSV